MKTKTLIKVLTICLFISLIIGFMLYKGGYLFSKEKIIINDEQTGRDMPVTSEEDYHVDAFKDLKSEGGFVPKNFGKLYTEPVVYDTRFLASSKSLVMTDFQFDQYGQSTSYLSMVVKEQLKSTQTSKK